MDAEFVVGSTVPEPFSMLMIDSETAPRVLVRAPVRVRHLFAHVWATSWPSAFGLRIETLPSEDVLVGAADQELSV